MSDYYRPGPYGAAPGLAASVPLSQLGFLRRVYTLFTGSLVFAAVGAFFALYAGASVSHVHVAGHVVPPMVAWLLNHGILAMIGYFGAYFAAVALRDKPGINVPALFGFTFVSGVYVSTILWFAQFQASQGHTLSASPVRDAFLLAVTGFGGLSGYALLTRRDFSFLRGFLSMGLWVLIGASLIGLFVGGEPFQLAIASVGVLLFGGFILYETSMLVRRGGTDRDAVSAALGLYLSFLNLFLSLLRILMSSRRSD